MQAGDGAGRHASADEPAGSRSDVPHLHELGILSEAHGAAAGLTRQRSIRLLQQQL